MESPPPSPKSKIKAHNLNQHHIYLHKFFELEKEIENRICSKRLRCLHSFGLIERVVGFAFTGIDLGHYWSEHLLVFKEPGQEHSASHGAQESGPHGSH